jgi:hypothetical protein
MLAPQVSAIYRLLPQGPRSLFTEFMTVHKKPSGFGLFVRESHHLPQNRERGRDEMVSSARWIADGDVRSMRAGGNQRTAASMVVLRAFSKLEQGPHVCTLWRQSGCDFVRGQRWSVEARARASSCQAWLSALGGRRDEARASESKTRAEGESEA